MRQAYCILLSVCALTLAARTFARDEKDVLLRLPLLPLGEQVHDRPLTSALSNVGSRIRGGYVMFGVEVSLTHGKEPSVTLPVEPAGNLGTALHEILLQLPNYEMRVESAHFIEIIPQSARNDPQDLLNLHVADFSVTKASAGTILINPMRFIPELQTRLYPKPSGDTVGPQPDGGIFSAGLQVTLHLHDVTIRQILDRVSEATEHFLPDQPPLGWAYSINSDNTPGIPKHAWGSLPSLPSDWREYRASGKPSE